MAGNYQDPKEFFIRIEDDQVPVTEEVYYAFKRPAWRERKRRQVRADKEWSLDASLDCQKDLSDTHSSVEDIIEDRWMRETLRQAMAQLPDEDQALVHALFFEGKSERAIAMAWGIPYTTLNYRKKRVLAKLKEYF